MAVVDRFQPIDVEHEHRQWRPVTGGVANEMSETRFKRSEIVQPRQIVRRGQLMRSAAHRPTSFAVTTATATNKTIWTMSASRGSQP